MRMTDDCQIAILGFFQEAAKESRLHISNTKKNPVWRVMHLAKESTSS